MTQKVTAKFLSPGLDDMVSEAANEAVFFSVAAGNDGVGFVTPWLIRPPLC
jgi:hypothetical protein